MHFLKINNYWGLHKTRYLLLMLLFFPFGVKAEGKASFLKQKSVNFGKLSLTDSKTIDIEINNPTKQVLKINSISPDNQQIVVDTFPKNIAAGKKGSIRIIIWPKKKAIIDAIVEIKYDNGISELLQVKGEVCDKAKKQEPTKIDHKKLFISLENFLKLKNEKKKITMIDIREKKDYDQYRINGSINIPLRSIKTSSWLRSKKIILVDNGFDSHSLHKKVSLLQKIGFNIKILKGGINTWWRSGQKLIGYPKLMTVSGISPAQLFASGNRKKLLVINLSGSTANNKFLNSFSSILISANNKEKFNEELKKSKTKIIPFEQIIVIDNNEKKYLRLDSYFRDKGSKNIFFLQGGINAFSTYNQKYIVGRKAEFVTSIEDCGCN